MSLDVTSPFWVVNPHFVLPSRFQDSPYLSSSFQLSDAVRTVTGRGISLPGSGPSFCRTQGSFSTQQMSSASSMEETQALDVIPALAVFSAIRTLTLAH